MASWTLPDTILLVRLCLQTAPQRHQPSVTSAAPGLGAIHRSKSAAAIPAMTGISIGRGGLMDQLAGIEAAEATKQQPDQGRSKVGLRTASEMTGPITDQKHRACSSDFLPSQ